nr:ABC transporter substrate-binding protein [Gordonia effusa]
MRRREARDGWFVAVVIIAVAAVLSLSSCTNDESLLDTKPITLTIAKQPAIAEIVPAEIRESGVLRIGTNPPYQPNEFKNRDGEIIGYDVDLMRAVSQVLGLRPEFKESDFDKIIPAIQSGTFDMGMSSFTDTAEREKQVDFVTYFSAGVLWAQRTDDDVDPDNACGLKVGVQATTYEDTDEVPAKSAKCVAQGKEPIVKVKFDSQDEAVNALLLGRVDALSADSPVTAYAVKKTDGQLEVVGPVYDAAPYGLPVRKGSSLGPALQRAMQYLMDNGFYRTISEHWGVQSGMIGTSKINDAAKD